MLATLKCSHILVLQTYLRLPRDIVSVDTSEVSLGLFFKALSFIFICHLKILKCSLILVLKTHLRLPRDIVIVIRYIRGETSCFIDARAAGKKMKVLSSSRSCHRALDRSSLPPTRPSSDDLSVSHFRSTLSLLTLTPLP